jgi:hypothetical protein
MTPTELSAVLTADVAALPGVRSVIPPGPMLAALVRDVRTVLDVPADGGRVLVRAAPDGLRLRIVVGVGSDTPVLDTIRAVRDGVVERVLVETGERPAEVVVRVVEID